MLVSYGILRFGCLWVGDFAFVSLVWVFVAVCYTCDLICLLLIASLWWFGLIVGLGFDLSAFEISEFGFWGF